MQSKEKLWADSYNWILSCQSWPGSKGGIDWGCRKAGGAGKLGVQESWECRKAGGAGRLITFLIQSWKEVTVSFL